MAIISAIVATFVIVISITYWVCRWWWNPKYSRLPPGSMGWPVFGETFQFFKPTTTLDIPPFFKERLQRYGPLFRTSMLGTPMVVSADPGFNHFVFQQEGELFESWYPTTFVEIFGRKNMNQVHGFMFKFMKNMVLSLFGPESLKNMIMEVEKAVLAELHTWSITDSVELRDATAKMIFHLTSKKLISHEPHKSSENLRDHFSSFIKGLITFPLNIPGTAYHRCLEGRKKTMRMLRSMLKERRAVPRKQEHDFFDYVLSELSREGTILTEEMALDLIFLLLFASYETTSMAMTLATKFLTEHPIVLQKLTEEHEAIIKRRGEKEHSGLTWSEFKSMSYTFQVINETLRLANIAPILFRKVLQDVNFMGYTIPTGWVIMMCPTAIHLNPTTYENPFVFNPSRWEGLDVNGATKNFLAFGGGMRLCVGSEFSKLQMAVYLHHLVTKYRWQVIRGGNIVRTPGLQFPQGFHVKLFERGNN